MKRSVTLTIMTVLLASVPAWAAPPFGSFGGQVGGGNAGANLMPLTGWALDDNGVNAVDILVDGVVVGRANYHRNRPEIAKKYPGYPDSLAAGFAYSLDTTHFLNGNHKVTAQIQSMTGEITRLPGKVIQFLNVTHNLVPFGKLEFPAPQAELHGNCNRADDTRRWTVISGYALDSGVQDYDTGVGYVELLIDRALYSNSRRDCNFDATTGGFSDCYGLRRLDIQPIFPGLKDAPHSGFRFILDLGVLLTRDPVTGFPPPYKEGQHVLTIRAGDQSGQVSLIGEIPVTFICQQHIVNEDSIGDIDQPHFGQLLSGFTYVNGWAVDWEGIGLVQVLIDGIIVGPAETGLVYPPLNGLYLGYPESAAPGWRLLLDTRQYSDGPHQIELLVTDIKGVSTYIGKRQFIIANP